MTVTARPRHRGRRHLDRAREGERDPAGSRRDRPVREPSRHRFGDSHHHADLWRMARGPHRPVAVPPPLPRTHLRPGRRARPGSRAPGRGGRTRTDAVGGAGTSPKARQRPGGGGDGPRAPPARRPAASHHVIRPGRRHGHLGPRARLGVHDGRLPAEVHPDGRGRHQTHRRRQRPAGLPGRPQRVPRADLPRPDQRPVPLDPLAVPRSGQRHRHRAACAVRDRPGQHRVCGAMPGRRGRLPHHPQRMPVRADVHDGRRHRPGRPGPAHHRPREHPRSAELPAARGAARRVWTPGPHRPSRGSRPPPPPWWTGSPAPWSSGSP